MKFSQNYLLLRRCTGDGPILSITGYRKKMKEKFVYLHRFYYFCNKKTKGHEEKRPAVCHRRHAADERACWLRTAPLCQDTLCHRFAQRAGLQPVDDVGKPAEQRRAWSADDCSGGALRGGDFHLRQVWLAFRSGHPHVGAADIGKRSLGVCADLPAEALAHSCLGSDNRLFVAAAEAGDWQKTEVGSRLKPLSDSWFGQQFAKKRAA